MTKTYTLGYDAFDKPLKSESQSESESENALPGVACGLGDFSLGEGVTDANGDCQCNDGRTYLARGADFNTATATYLEITDVCRTGCVGSFSAGWLDAFGSCL